MQSYIYFFIPPNKSIKKALTNRFPITVYNLPPKGRDGSLPLLLLHSDIPFLLCHQYMIPSWRTGQHLLRKRNKRLPTFPGTYSDRLSISLLRFVSSLRFLTCNYTTFLRFHKIFHLIFLKLSNNDISFWLK